MQTLQFKNKKLKNHFYKKPKQKLKLKITYISVKVVEKIKIDFIQN